MKISIFKKSMAYLVDAIPIIFILMIMNTLFVGELLKNQYPDYDTNYETYQDNLTDYNDELDLYYNDLEAELITQDEYDTQAETLKASFVIVNEATEEIIFDYFTIVLYYFLIGFILLKYIYILVTKGQTFGLKMMKLELVGRINWFNLLLREIFWREVFWIFTFGVGLMIDLIMVTFTPKGKSLRDIFSNTQVIYQGTSYPF